MRECVYEVFPGATMWIVAALSLPAGFSNSGGAYSASGEFPLPSFGLRRTNTDTILDSEDEHDEVHDPR
jgi:hypothetical protein